jgi:ferritin-like metal-binding protein YciE
MANQKTFRDIFMDELRDLYDCEKQLVKALPTLAKSASSVSLRDALTSHLEETRHHVTRLEHAFELIGERPRGKHCAGIAGIIEEGGALLAENVEGAALDAAIIAGGQRAEHYEMAAYGCVSTWAATLGFDEVAGLLDETLAEEKAADRKLTELAEAGINADAAANRGAEQGEQDERGALDDESSAPATSRNAGRAGSEKASGTMRRAMAKSSR